MTEREVIEALRQEVAALRGEVASLRVQAGQVHHHHHYPPPPPQPLFPVPLHPWSPNICQSARG
jgi:hypothetical protein